MEEMAPTVWLRVRRGCLLWCECVAGYLYQLALLDGREGQCPDAILPLQQAGVGEKYMQNCAPWSFYVSLAPVLDGLQGLC